MTSSPEDLWHRERIREVIYQYCSGVDRCNWDLVRDCFTSDAIHRHLEFTGTTDEFIGFATRILKAMDGTLHTIGNVLLSTNDDSAQSESTFVAYHRIRGDSGELSPIPTGGQDLDWIVAGRYVDEWRLAGGLWKIANRQAFHDWTRVEPAMPR